MFASLASATKVRIKDVRTWQQTLKVGVTARSALLDKVAFEFGWTRAVGKSKELEESFEQSVDADFLRERLAEFVADCRVLGDYCVLLFIDNLDQATYPQRDQEVEQVLDLARMLFSLQNAVVVMTVRSEFVSRDLPKYESWQVPLSGMNAAALSEVARKRMSGARDDKQKALKDAGFETIIDHLANWTQNPWAFLKWLAALDQTREDLRNATSPEVV